MPNSYCKVVSTLVLGLTLAGCSTYRDELNTKLSGENLEQKLSTLQDQCTSTAKTFDGTKLKSEQPYKYTLTKICAAMGEQIKLSQKMPQNGSSETFDRLYESCLDEAKNNGSMFVTRSHNHPNHQTYYYRARALCDTYKDMMPNPQTGVIRSE